MNAARAQHLGLGRWSASSVSLFLFGLPRLLELDTVLKLTIYMIMAILALSLG